MPNGALRSLGSNQYGVINTALCLGFGNWFCLWWTAASSSRCQAGQLVPRLLGRPQRWCTCTDTCEMGRGDVNLRGRFRPRSTLRGEPLVHALTFNISDRHPSAGHSSVAVKREEVQEGGVVVCISIACSCRCTDCLPAPRRGSRLHCCCWRS